MQCNIYDNNKHKETNKPNSHHLPIGLPLWQLQQLFSLEVTLFFSWHWGELLWGDDSWWIVEIYILASCLGIVSHSQPIEPLCFPDHLSHCFLLSFLKVPENSSRSGCLIPSLHSRKINSVNLIHVCNESN